MGPIEHGVDPLGPAIGPCKIGVYIPSEAYHLPISTEFDDKRLPRFGSKLDYSIGER